MPKSLSELRRQLSAIEPDERTYEGIGPDDVDLLRQIVATEDEPWLSARAVYALARIDTDEARSAVITAIDSPLPEVRVAVAFATQRLPATMADEALVVLLDDPDSSVRKFAIKSVDDRSSDVLKRRVREIAATESTRWLRDVADDKTRTISPPG